MVAGRVYRTAAGRLCVSAVDMVRPDRISAVDARRAGYRTATELLADLRGDDAWPVYRLQVLVVRDPDPRAVLAADDDLGPDEVAALAARLDRLDRASSHGPWTALTLDLIARRPAVRAGDLAASVGREMLPFKVDVRKLKNLGYGQPGRGLPAVPAWCRVPCRRRLPLTARGCGHDRADPPVLCG